jgi:hypothetical protein
VARRSSAVAMQTPHCGGLARRGVIADVYVFGGAAMALAYDARRATRDLAMKVLAARRRDSDDIRFLIRRLGLASVDEVLAVCADV